MIHQSCLGRRKIPLRVTATPVILVDHIKLLASYLFRTPIPCDINGSPRITLALVFRLPLQYCEARKGDVEFLNPVTNFKQCNSDEADQRRSRVTGKFK